MRIIHTKYLAILGFIALLPAASANAGPRFDPYMSRILGAPIAAPTGAGVIQTPGPAFADRGTRNLTTLGIELPARAQASRYEAIFAGRIPAVPERIPFIPLPSDRDSRGDDGSGEGNRATDRSVGVGAVAYRPVDGAGLPSSQPTRGGVSVGLARVFGGSILPGSLMPALPRPSGPILELPGIGRPIGPTGTSAPVPEPGAALLFGMGSLVVGAGFGRKS